MLNLSQTTTQSMGRPRKNPKDNQLPNRVTRNKYSYVWKPKGSKKTITPAPLAGTSMSKLWARYEEEKANNPNPDEQLASLQEKVDSAMQNIEKMQEKVEAMNRIGVKA